MKRTTLVFLAALSAAHGSSFTINQAGDSILAHVEGDPAATPSGGISVIGSGSFTFTITPGPSQANGDPSQGISVGFGVGFNVEPSNCVPIDPTLPYECSGSVNDFADVENIGFSEMASDFIYGTRISYEDGGPEPFYSCNGGSWTGCNTTVLPGTFGASVSVSETMTPDYNAMVIPWTAYASVGVSGISGICDGPHCYSVPAAAIELVDPTPEPASGFMAAALLVAARVARRRLRLSL